MEQDGKANDMQSLLLPLFAFVFIGSCSGATLHGRATPANVTWGGCSSRGPPYECTTVKVPLDWQDESKGTIPLVVARLPASKTPKKGYMFYNPGGPGLPGTTFIQSTGSELQEQIGADWDVISWDPRGVGESGPAITMFDTDAGYLNFWNQLQGPGSYSTHGNLTVSSDADFFKSQASKFDNMTITFNNLTMQQNGDSLKYVGTCAVVRDLVFLVDSIYGEGSDVNFWGISYGSAVGLYLTQMFPDRVGKVILDGVYDGEKHATVAPMKWLDQDYKSIETALTKWTEACATGSSICKFASAGNKTPEGIMSKIKQITDTSYRIFDGTPPTVNDLLYGPSTADPTKWSYELIIRTIRTGLYDQQLWKSLDALFQTLLAMQSGTPASKDAELDSRLFAPNPMPYSNIPYYVLDYANFAIYCSDTIDPQGETTQDLFNLTVQAAQSVSPNFASLTPTQSLRSFCHNWKARAVERLSEPMTKKPKNVILVIGNTGDPITPYESAQRVA
ncbi:hypothetical protein FRC19_006808, partial [Serendipita sp. 401]